jgi:hypothetical protein
MTRLHGNCQEIIARDDCHAIRHMLNLESLNVYKGTHTVHTLFSGCDITGRRDASLRKSI